MPAASTADPRPIPESDGQPMPRADAPDEPAKPTKRPQPVQPDLSSRMAHGLLFATPEGAQAFLAHRSKHPALTLQAAMARIVARQQQAQHPEEESDA